MLDAAIADGTANRHCTFEVFARRLPNGRRYGVVAGTARFVQALASFGFDAAELSELVGSGVIRPATADYLSNYRFTGDISGYAEGEPWFPQSPVLTVSGTFAETVLLETLALSILNHDCAVAAAAARMVIAAGDRPIIEMGSRRTHEQAAPAAARAAYLAGFASTSNLAAGAWYEVPTAGTAAHAFTLLYDTEAAAFAAQLATGGVGTTLLVDTYDISAGIDTAIRVAGPELGAIRIDSGDLGVLAHRSRAQLDALGATKTRIVVSGDLDEYAMAGLAAAPVDAYGAGTAVVVGSGAPTAGLIYKLVEVEGRAVAKRSENKVGVGGAKFAYRRHRDSGTATAEVVGLSRDRDALTLAPTDRLLTVDYVRDGVLLPLPGLTESRARHRAAMTALPWQALALSAGDPGLPVVLPETH
ncbi:MAG: putative nicotinate phosphoribosyltransferase [Frankiales bacterium]|nr:putative nicotinate phosphoribosyltransferase [Frankiales bacterium]